MVESLQLEKKAKQFENLSGLEGWFTPADPLLNPLVNLSPPASHAQHGLSPLDS